MISPLKKLRRERYISLNVKLMAVLLIAAVAAVFSFALLSFSENMIANKMYLSEKGKTREVNARYTSLRQFISDEEVCGTDAVKLQTWMAEQEYTEIIVTDMKAGDVFSAGWVATTDPGLIPLRREAAGSGAGTSLNRRDLNVDDEDLYNRTVTFFDKQYYVFIDVYSESAWYSVTNSANVIIVAVIFLLIVLFYNRTTLKRIIELSRETQKVSRGDLGYAIQDETADEIGNLAVSIDSMRNSILEKMENEKAARDANNELITSMSHDIRTPLTSLIGYLEIIEWKKYNSDEEYEKYIRSSREKADQLRDLSDKLFQYFLVFGSDEKEIEMEAMDGGILFQQILIEHMTEAMTKGIPIHLQYDVPEGLMIRTEISLLQRLFDNLFSNIMKYASRDFDVEIKADYIAGRIKIILQNHISTDARKVESNKIGVKTCKRISENLGAEFHVMEEKKIYTTELLFPVLPAEENTEEAGPSAEGQEEKV